MYTYTRVFVTLLVLLPPFHIPVQRLNLRESPPLPPPTRTKRNCRKEEQQTEQYYYFREKLNVFL